MKLPNRRYQRGVEAISLTEKLIGVGVLLTLAGLLVAFVYHTRTNQDYILDTSIDEYIEVGAVSEPAAGGGEARESVGESEEAVTGVASGEPVPQVDPQDAADTRVNPAVTRERLEESRRMPAATAEPVADKSARESSDVFPSVSLADWRTPTETRYYSADDLYIEINGQAPAYLERGCTGLTVGTYEHATDEERGIDVYVFDMATSENARAMYDAELPPEVEQFELGQAAYEVGSSVFMCAGAKYVHVMPWDLEESSKEAALKIAGRIASR